MAQHDYVIDNQSFPATRSDLNSLFQAIASSNSGATAPSTTYANQLWYDTANNKLYIRNEDNDQFIELFVLDQTGDHLEKIGNTITLDGTGNTTLDGDLTIPDKIIHSGDTNTAVRFPAADTISFETGGSERSRVDSTGNLLIAQTSGSSSDVGHILAPTGAAFHVRDGGIPLILDRLTSDGEIARIRKDGTTVGQINAVSGDLAIGTDDTALKFEDSTNAIKPFNANSNGSRDNAIDLGTSGARFDDIFATNSTIQTSDQNEKQQIASLTDAEITAAKAISKLFKTFKWNDKVEAKGDAARTHAGVVAQDVNQAMTDAGLDSANYAFWCSNTWWETQTEVPAVEADEENGIEAQEAYTRTDTYNTAEEAPEGATERTRLGIRYPELLAFIGAATEQRLTSIEARLTALEA